MGAEVARVSRGILFTALVAGLAYGQGVGSGVPASEFQGKVVVAGSGVQVETAIDVIADALEKGSIPYKIVSGDTSRRAENDKLLAVGAVSLLYINSDIMPRQRPKLIVECWDTQGKSLWKEETSLTVTSSAQSSAKRMAERIAKDLEKSRIGGPGLPKK
jgi:hypothetical protein